MDAKVVSSDAPFPPGSRLDRGLTFASRSIQAALVEPQTMPSAHCLQYSGQKRSMRSMISRDERALPSPSFPCFPFFFSSLIANPNHAAELAVSILLLIVEIRSGASTMVET